MQCWSHLHSAYKTISSPWLIILKKRERESFRFEETSQKFHKKIITDTFCHLQTIQRNFPKVSSKQSKKRDCKNVIPSTSVHSFESLDTIFSNISTTDVVFVIVRWWFGLIFIVHIDLWHRHRSFCWRGRTYSIGRNLVQVSQEEVPEWLLFKVIYSYICYHCFISTAYHKVWFRCVHVKICSWWGNCVLINLWLSIAQHSNFLTSFGYWCVYMFYLPWYFHNS